MDRLVSLGFLATCNPGGAGKWKEDYCEFLRDRPIVILPDNDDDGQKHAQAVARSLTGIGKIVRIVNLPGLPVKGDISDWRDAGGTRDRLVEVVRAAPVSEAPGFPAVPPKPEEWRWVRATLAEGAEREGMPAEERMLLYAVAIQTGLRSSELRSLTRGRLFLDGDEPFVTCKAGSTKSRQDAATVARLANMLGRPRKAQRMRSSQGAIWCRTMRRGATKKTRHQETAQALTLYELRACAKTCETMRSGGHGSRTHNGLRRT